MHFLCDIRRISKEKCRTGEAPVPGLCQNSDDEYNPRIRQMGRSITPHFVSLCPKGGEKAIDFHTHFEVFIRHRESMD